MVEEEDFMEMWAVVMQLESIQMTAAFVAAYCLIPWQIDFTSVYLNSNDMTDFGLKL